MSPRPPLRSTLLAILLAGLVLGGCRPSAVAVDSGVEGHVWVGPMCPVIRPGVDCPDRPLEADLEVLDPSGRVVARARSDSDGAYRIPLPAGEYVLSPLSPGEAGIPSASPLPLQVPDGSWVSLDIHYDSGIR